MKRKRYADEQIAIALRQAESGTSVEDICRKMGVSEPTFCRSRKQFAEVRGAGSVSLRGHDHGLIGSGSPRAAHQ
jgi:putative transposase